MTFFTEVDWSSHPGGRIAAVEPGSLGAEIALRPGDELLAVNGTKVEDVIDVQFYAAEEDLELLVRRDGEYYVFEAERQYAQSLGLEFEHPTFDTDIRRCNNLCEFCFVLQMAPRFRRTLYIKDDDYRYSFLLGHFVTLTNLNEHDWWRIEMMRLSPLYVSVHVTDLEMRRRFLRNPHAPDIMEQLRWLGERGIELHTQLVVVPDFNDGPWLERSIHELAGLWPSVRSISVVPVGLTRHHKYGMRPHTQAEARRTLAYLESLQPSFRQRLGVRFVYPTDEWYLVSGRPVPELPDYDGYQLQENGLGMVRAFLEEWRQVKREIHYWRGSQSDWPVPYRTATLVTGTLFSPTLQDAAVEFGALTDISLEVVPVINHSLGETITVAGLLMAEDVIAQLADRDNGDLVVLPRIMFDHPDRVSLDDVDPQQVANRLQRPVALADLMGDIWDAVRQESAAFYLPSTS